MTVLAALPEAREGMLSTWNRSAHAQYQLQDTSPSRPIPFKTLCGKLWPGIFFFCCFRYMHIEDTAQLLWQAMKQEPTGFLDPRQKAPPEIGPGPTA